MCLKIPFNPKSSHLNVMKVLQFVGLLIDIAPTTYFLV